MARPFSPVGVISAGRAFLCPFSPIGAVLGACALFCVPLVLLEAFWVLVPILRVTLALSFLSS